METKWLINYSSHEELTPGNEKLSELFQTNADKQNLQKQLHIVREDYQMHSYTMLYSLVPEAKKSLKESVERIIMI